MYLIIYILHNIYTQYDTVCIYYAVYTIKVTMYIVVPKQRLLCTPQPKKLVTQMKTLINCLFDFLCLVFADAQTIKRVPEYKNK